MKKYYLFLAMIHCPWSHKYAYLSGQRCCSTPWKYSSGPEDDCDGHYISLHSKCCPQGLSIPCKKNGELRRCKNHVTNMGRSIVH